MSEIRTCISPAPRAEWRALLRADPQALVDQSPSWADAQMANGFVDASRYYAFDDGRRFVLPLTSRRTHRFGPRRGHGSGWGMGGLVGPGLTAEHVSAIIADLATLPSVYVHIRPNPLQAKQWETADTTVAQRIARRAHVVDLQGGAEATYRRFRRSGRRGIDKAERAGVQVDLYTGGDMLEAYYNDLFLASVERWSAQQREPLILARFRAQRRDPLTKLKRIAGVLGEDFRLYLATVDDELVAGNLVVWTPNAHATRAAMDYDLARPTQAAYALEWAAIQDACRAGHRWYQMGESGQDQNLAAYKERFGAVAVDYAEYRVERLPVLAADRAARSLVKRLIGFED